MTTKPIITLLTDFGSSDPYVGMMKGMLLRLGFRGPIVDLTHGIAAQDVAAGAFWLEKSTPYFPLGSIHVAVVDPGVGTSRRGIILKSGSHTFVGPDNGIFGRILSRARGPVQSWRLERERVQALASGVLAESATFDGRDLFAPSAAMLANGFAPISLGEPIEPSTLAVLPARDPGRATIIVVDHFGNLLTDYDCYSDEPLTVEVRDVRVRWVRTYGDAPPGELVALRSSSNVLELAVTNGSAAEKTGLRVGDTIFIASSPRHSSVES